MTQRASHLRRLPPGIAALRADLGDILNKARLGPAGAKYQHNLAAIADKVRVDRVTLWRIERGITVPRMDTLKALLLALDLTLEQVTLEGASMRRPLIVAGGEKVRLEIALGKKLRLMRKRFKLSLAKVSDASGVSTAQLSRIERGQVPRSRLIAREAVVQPSGKAMQILAYSNAVLQKLHDGEWRPPEA